MDIEVSSVSFADLHSVAESMHQVDAGVFPHCRNPRYPLRNCDRRMLDAYALTRDTYWGFGASGVAAATTGPR
jgi:hypothetical protein